MLITIIFGLLATLLSAIYYAINVFLHLIPFYSSIDNVFIQIMGYWNSFMNILPYTKVVWSCLLIIIQFEIALLAVKLVLGHRSPLPND